VAWGRRGVKQILFAPKDDWIDPVRDRLDAARFQPSFFEFHETELALFDCIVPLRLKDYASLRRNEKALANLLIPNHMVVDITDDKPRFNTWLGDNGFDDCLPSIRAGSRVFPFIYKKRRDQAGKNSRVIYSLEEQQAFENAVDIANYFQQRYVGGRKEYTTHFLAANGLVKFDTTVEFTFQSDYFIRGIREPENEITKIETPFREVFCEILEALGYNGTCCFNYKIENGRPLIFEINPRCGSSLRLDLNAYVEAYLEALEERRRAA
jgi:carbamoylphosphate synthase large subunit